MDGGGDKSGGGEPAGEGEGMVVERVREEVSHRDAEGGRGTI